MSENNAVERRREMRRRRILANSEQRMKRLLGTVTADGEWEFVMSDKEMI